MIEKNCRTLLVVAHGSRSRSWTQAVTTLVGQMASERPVDSPFDDIRPAFLENASPSIAEALDAAAARGATEIQALPLFLTRSGHLQDDVPAAVDGRAALLRPLEPTRWLIGNLLRRLGRRETDAFDRTGVVLVAYGSSTHGHLWDAMLGEVCHGLREHGVADAAFAYVGHVAGLSPQPTFRALEQLAATGRRIERLCVLPVLFGVGMLQTGPIQQAVDMAREQLAVPTDYDSDAILPDLELARAFLNHATILTLDGPRPQSNQYAT